MTIIAKNADYASKIKTLLGTRYEPVAVKLVDDSFKVPSYFKEPEGQISHCQAVFRAKGGECLSMPFAKHACHVGTSAMNMSDTPEKVASGDFHNNIGIHNSAAAAGKMISERMVPAKRSTGEIVCPLSKADFEPDVVAIIDVPERIYWVEAASTAEKGGRAQFSTSPFQCVCEDIVSVPIVTGRPNISLGCYGCRRKTDMKPEEMVCGIPYADIPAFAEQLGKYGSGVLTKAKRD